MSTRRERLLFRVINIYPPYVGAGIRVRHRQGDERTIRVEMRLRFWNRNLFGTHFGGSLYAMCDPWFVFLLVRHLGDGYLVWDKAAAIEFLKPGRGRVTATFHVSTAEVAEIRAAADKDGKTEPVLTAEIVGEGGEVVARVRRRSGSRGRGRRGRRETARRRPPNPRSPGRSAPPRRLARPPAPGEDLPARLGGA
ncbi:MAG: YiiD C-terminal domain-containing protein [Holophagales bacterium]|nr:YiiD C-terminal domain-containing protein [Holophagales bacterium]